MPPFDVYDAFDRDAKLPDQLSSAKWAKAGAPVSTGESAGKALTVALVKLEQLYKKVNTADLRPPKGKVFASLEELEQAEKNAKSAYRSTVVPLISQAIEVKKQAQALAKVCQANAKLKVVTGQLVEMGKQAEQVADDLKDLGMIFKPFDDARKLLVKATDHLRKTLSPHLSALGKGLDACLKAPTREGWDKLCMQPCKAIHNTIKNTPQLKEEFWSVWKVHDGDSFSHALQVAEKSGAKDPRNKQKIAEIITRMCRDLKKEVARLEDVI
jgi:hypothetical protein